MCVSRLQATFLPSLYEEDFLWKNLVIAVLAVCISSPCSRWSRSAGPGRNLHACLCSAVPPVHPAALPASVA